MATLLGSHRAHDYVRWIECRNDSGEEIPPYAVLDCTGVITRNGQKVVTVNKPSAPDNEDLAILLNGPQSIGIDQYGLCTGDLPAYARYSGTVSTGKTLDVKLDTWTLTPNRNGRYVVIGGDEDSTVFVTAALGELIVEGVLDADLVAADAALDGESTATLSVYVKDNDTGNLVDSNRNVTITNRFTEISTVVKGTWVVAKFINGEWRPIAADCGNTALFGNTASE